ncbi:MAG: hypothetical protein GF346_09165, partial [Candidatus Eisenbacteria bacterium]|nr:hypothetical protein [Candidatus Latescibacterota bacterium]MBD3302600.1 hypothetical protein [Candidatus Eisenbacteria bacterium]
NQFQAIELNLNSLREGRIDEPDRVRRHAEKAAQGIESIDDAVRGFLKIARLRPPTPRTIQPNDVLHEIARELRTEAGMAGVRIELALHPALPQTQVDPDMLRQAMMNVVRNSLQALAGSEGGVIRIRSARAEGWLRITVEDDGPGIPPELREKIFDPFFTTRKDGSGVGLALVRQSIEMQGGRATIESEEGRGTVVVLELPWSP